MAEPEKGYQGWKNYETWAVSLWIDNEEVLYNQMYGRCRALNDPAKLAEEIKNLVEESNPMNRVQPTSMFHDLMTSAISEVDFREIAEAMTKECTE